MYKKIIIGVDQSYQNTGISVVVDGHIKNIGSINLSKVENNSDKRIIISQRLERLIINMLEKKPDELYIFCEKIRLRSQGFINIDYIKSIGALNATIVDIAHKYNIQVYSADTRSWKAQVVGTAKPKSNNIGVDPNKWPTIQYLVKLGYQHKILVPASKQKKKGVFEIDGKRYTYNDDAADSACIALYGFIPKNKQLLSLEH
jgi:hypothetical protein